MRASILSRLRVLMRACMCAPPLACLALCLPMSRFESGGEKLVRPCDKVELRDRKAEARVTLIASRPEPCGSLEVCEVNVSLEPDLLRPPSMCDELPWGKPLRRGGSRNELVNQIDPADGFAVAAVEIPDGRGIMEGRYTYKAII